jgi:hypothetical protein
MKKFDDRHLKNVLLNIEQDSFAKNKKEAHTFTHQPIAVPPRVRTHAENIDWELGAFLSVDRSTRAHHYA